MFQAFLICLIQEKGKKKKPEVRLKFADEVEEGEIFSEVSQLDSDTKHPTPISTKQTKLPRKQLLHIPQLSKKQAATETAVSKQMSPILQLQRTPLI